MEFLQPSHQHVYLLFPVEKDGGYTADCQGALDAIQPLGETAAALPEAQST
jgi:hypothetical protein